MNKRAEKYIRKINDEIEESQKSYYPDTKTECMHYAMLYAMCWIAEELNTLNGGNGDG